MPDSGGGGTQDALLSTAPVERVDNLHVDHVLRLVVLEVGRAYTSIRLATAHVTPSTVLLVDEAAVEEASRGRGGAAAFAPTGNPVTAKGATRSVGGRVQLCRR